MMLVSAAGGLLYFQVRPALVDAEPDAAGVELARIAADVDVPSVPGPPGQATGAGSTHEPATGNVVRGRTALLMNLLLLERGCRELEETSDYTAVFYKRERIGTVMGDEQVMRLKVRHKPFSVYAEWLVNDKGRELIYVDGQNDGKMIVKAGGIKGRLLPPLKLDIDGPVAMKEARHPITHVGLLHLARKAVEYRRRDLDGKTGARCTMLDGRKVNDRSCYCFIIDYPDPKRSPLYRKSVMFIDEERLVPVWLKTWGWPDESAEIDPADLDDATLLEHYSYSDVRVNQQLADRDFDRSRLKRRVAR